MGDMGCRETRREIERYVDGECLQALTVQVETHLADCIDCHDHAEFKRHLKLLIATKCGGEALPEGLAARRRTAWPAAPPPGGASPPNIRSQRIFICSI
jgi:mycothiol system anti-sigma-R factor